MCNPVVHQSFPLGRLWSNPGGPSRDLASCSPHGRFSARSARAANGSDIMFFVVDDSRLSCSEHVALLCACCVPPCHWVDPLSYLSSLLWHVGRWPAWLCNLIVVWCHLWSSSLCPDTSLIHVLEHLVLVVDVATAMLTPILVGHPDCC